MLSNLLKPASFDLVAIFANLKTEWYFYLVLIGIFAIIFSLVYFIKPQEKINLKKTTKLAFIAMLSALCVIANIYSFGSQDIKFSFVSLVCFVAGFILGPIGGFAVGFIGDLIAGLIFPFGVYNPIIALGSSLFGCIPGVIFGYFKGNNFIKTIISYLICYFICSVILNSTATYLMYFLGSTKYSTLFAYLAVRIPPTLITQLINLAISLLLVPALNRIKEMLVKNSNNN